MREGYMVKKENSSLIELTLDEKKLFIQWGGGDTTWLDYACTRHINNCKNKNRKIISQP